MNLSRYGDRHEKTYSRQSKKGLKAGKFNAAFVSVEIPEEHEVIGLLDASFTLKSGKQTFGLDRFYNGSHGRVERGLKISLLAVVDTVTENAYTIHASQTYSQSLYPLITRTEHYLMQVQENRGNLPERVRYLAVDSAHANAPFIEGVLAQKLEVISKLRQNANLHYVFEGAQTGKGAPRKYYRKVNFSDLSRFTRLADVE